MCNYINCDSFGDHVPENWEAIADAMNNYIEEKGIIDDNDALCQLWENYWAGLVDADIIPTATETEV